MTSEGGFFPNGVSAVFSSIVVVVFSMVGAEIATVAAAESSDPEQAIARATQSVILRVATFFVGSMVLLVLIVPWDDNDLGDSPYVAAFSEMGIPAADHIMNAVVLTAVLSCLNSGPLHRVPDGLRAAATPPSSWGAGPRALRTCNSPFVHLAYGYNRMADALQRLVTSGRGGHLRPAAARPRRRRPRAGRGRPGCPPGW